MPTSTLKGMPRPKKDEPSDQVRLARSLVRRLRRLAGHEHADVAELVLELIDGPLAERERKMVAEMQSESEPSEPAKKAPERKPKGGKS